MTIAGANYREGVAFDPNGAMYVTLSGGTDVAVADGGTGASTAQGAAKNLSVPYILSQTGIPFIHISSGSMGNNGALTGVTALPFTYSGGAYIYLPANAIAASSAAGWYWAVFSSTTAATVYNSTYTSGQPQVGTMTAFATTGPGAFTGDTTDRTGPAITLPAGSLGPNGGLHMICRWAATSNANAKSLGVKAGATAITPLFALASNLNADAYWIWQNRGTQGAQIGSINVVTGLGFNAASGSSRISTSTDTSAAVTINLNIGKGSTATDNAILEGYQLIVYYGA